MTLHILDAITCFIGLPIKEFHYDMFHGHASRRGISYPHDPACFLKDTWREQLHISHTGSRLPDVFKPSGNLIVSEDVRNALAGLPNIEFLPVVFDKLFEYPFQAGDMSWYDTPRTQRPSDLHNVLPDVPEFHKTSGTYYEVITARAQDIAANYETHTVDVTLGIPPTGECVTTQVSSAALREFPILWDGPIQVNEEAFSRLSRFIDWDYFSEACIDL